MLINLQKSQKTGLLTLLTLLIAASFFCSSAQARPEEDTPPRNTTEAGEKNASKTSSDAGKDKSAPTKDPVESVETTKTSETKTPEPEPEKGTSEKSDETTVTVVEKKPAETEKPDRSTRTPKKIQPREVAHRQTNTKENGESNPEDKSVKPKKPGLSGTLEKCEPVEFWKTIPKNDYIGMIFNSGAPSMTVILRGGISFQPVCKDTSKLQTSLNYLSMFDKVVAYVDAERVVKISHREGLAWVMVSRVLNITVSSRKKTIQLNFTGYSMILKFYSTPHLQKALKALENHKHYIFRKKDPAANDKNNV